MAEAVSRIIQQRIERTKERLENVDENIRKLTGRNVEEWRPSGDQRRISIGDLGGAIGVRLGQGGGIGSRLGPRRGGGRSRGPSGLGTGRMDAFQRLGVPLKRQSMGSAFSRLGSRVESRDRDESDEEEDEAKKPTLQSSVVATTPINKTREDTVKDQQKDGKGQARNKRMFGLLLGTLHKFKQEATHEEDKNVRRAKIEEKLNQKAEDEKQAVATEKRQLFNERTAKQREVSKLEHLMVLANEQEEWNKHTAELSNFIYTKARPRLFYVPKQHTPETMKRLQESKEEMMAKIIKRKQDLNKQLGEVENEKNKRQERMDQRDNEQREEKENRRGRERILSRDGHRRRKSSEGKGKDEPHVSSHDREKRTRDRHEDRSDSKRQRTRSRSDDPHKKEKSEKKTDDIKKEDLSSEKGAEAVASEVAATSVGATSVEATSVEVGKTGKFEGEVHDGKGVPEAGQLDSGKNEIPVIGGQETTAGQDKTTETESPKTKPSDWVPDVDLSSIQLPDGPGMPIPKIQDSQRQTEELNPPNDFQMGEADEQLDYNETME